jgi:hypothetical protein
VQKDKESWALFPEYIRHQTAEERIAAIDAGRRESELEHRQERANAWRKVRARLVGFPEPLRSKLLCHWNTRTMLPGDPYRLASMLTAADRGEFDPDAADRDNERCRALGELSRQISSIAQLPIWPGMGPADETFLKLHVSHEIMRGRRPDLFLPRTLGIDDGADVFALIERRTA